MSLKSSFVKWALVSCYEYRGVDHKKWAVDDSEASYIETDNYAVRQQRYNRPDFVISRNGILVYDYCPDPREHPYKGSSLMTLREFLKYRQHAQIRRAGDPISQSKMNAIMKDYLVRAKERGLKQTMEPEVNLDWENYRAAEEENRLGVEQSITRINDFIDNSFKIRLASWFVGL